MVQKKRKTILTKYGKNIECNTIKQYNAFELITDKRKKALEKIKKQRDTLDQLNRTESLLLEIILKNVKI
jgi:hypothetical protein